MRYNKLVEVAEIQTGPFGSQLHKNDYVKIGTPIVTVEHLGQKDFSTQNLPCVADEDKQRLSKYILKYGDIVFSRVGSVDRCSYVSKKYDGWMFSGRCLRIRPLLEVDSEYLYYFFCLNETKEFVRGIATGATMPSINTKFMGEVPVWYPEIETQKKIASILAMIDNKIMLNNQINENLEEQAQLIFNERFISNDYEASQETTLGEICNCILGGTPSRAKAEYWNGDIPWINSGEINRFRITSPSELITQYGLNHSATKMLPAKTTVLAITGATLGQISLLEIDACANQSVVGILPNEVLPYEFIYPFIKANIKELISHQTGGAQQHINKQNVESLTVAVPTMPILEAFKVLVSPIYSMIASNCFEITRLEQLRDSLLPKLMSGELDVSAVQL
ncbi:MAG: restriction endonuclease subunit S [Eubacteriales bacterium]|nr:restriction endonuclease subunit S [Eubacteriales bacterium]